MTRAKRASAKTKPSTKGGKSTRTAPKPLSANKQLVKDAAKTANNRLRSDALGMEFDSVGVKREVVRAVVNPNIVMQFLWGYCSAVVGVQDNFQSGVDASAMAVYFFVNLKSLALQSGVRWPKKIVQLSRSLQTQNFGRYTFEVDWTVYDTAVNNLPATTGTINTYGIMGTYTSTNSTSNSYYVANTFSVLPSQNQFNDIFAQYANKMEVVTVDSTIKGDPSALAYDLAGAKQASDTQSQFYNAVPAAFIGFGGAIGNQLSLYILQTGAVGLEVPIQTPWLAALRVCTPITGVSNSSNTGYIFPQGVGSDNSRYPNYVQRVCSFPSVIGHNLGGNYGNPLNTVVKLTPALSAVQDIVNRIEAYAGQNASFKSQLLSTFSKNDVVQLAYGIYKSQLARYCNATAGLDVIGPNTTYVYYAEPGVRTAWCQLDMCRFPVGLLDALGAFRPYTSSRGAIIPLATIITDLTVITTSLTYSGTAIMTLPASSSGQYNLPYPTSVVSLAQAWKNLEPLLAGTVEIMPLIKTGRTLMDVSITREQATNNCIAIFARTPITQDFRARIMNAIQFVGYDYAPGVSTGTDNIQAMPQIQDRTKVYQQDYYYPLTGKDTVAALGKLYMVDGFVPLSASPDNNPILPYSNVASPLPPPTTPPKGLISAWSYESVKNKLAPRHGNYCGPMYTAGVDVSDGTNPPIKGGRYLVDPVDDLDAICKRHDEAYYHAAGDVGAKARADAALVKEIDSLPSQSYYSRLARAWFSPANYDHRYDL